MAAVGRPLVDLTDKRFGMLLVLRRAQARPNYKDTLWLCQCDCGNERPAPANMLTSGRQKSCGCNQYKALVKDRAGQRFGKLTVLSLQPREPKRKGALWLCRCDCGVEKVLSSHSLGGVVNSCGCGMKGPRPPKHPPGEIGFRAHLRQYIQGAELRGISFELSDDQFRAACQGDCFYCGVAPSDILPPGARKGTITPETAKHGTFRANGLDRVDSSKGYVLQNVVACCTDCNLAKMERSAEDFVSWAHRLSQYQHNKKAA